MPINFTPDEQSRTDRPKTLFSQIILPNRAKGVNHFAISDAYSRVGDIGRNYENHSGRHPVLFALYHEFQFTLQHMNDLLVWVRMSRHLTIGFNIPMGDRHSFRMNKFSRETGEYFPLIDSS